MRALFLALCLWPALACAQNFQTPVPHVILMDHDSGTVLFEKDADKLVSPASLVKLMTAEIVFRALKEGQLTLDRTFIVSENAWRKGGAPAGGSAMFARVHSQIAIADLLRGLIIMSGNDAAITLAEGMAGSEENFAQAMTQRARELGFDKMTFKNAWGKYDPEQKVTARQLAQLASHIIRTYPDYYKYFGEREFTWNKIRQQNRNPLLFMNIGADGLKTGNVEDSGFALVGSAVENQSRMIVALVGAKTARERAEEGRKLLSFGLRSFETRPLFAQGAQVGTASLYGGEKPRVSLLAPRPISVLVPRGNGEALSARIVYQGPIRAPIGQGVEIARLVVFRGKARVLETPLVTGEGIGEGNLGRKAMDAGYELGLRLFSTYVLRK